MYIIQYNKLSDQDIQSLVDRLHTDITPKEREEINYKLLCSISKYITTKVDKYDEDMIQTIYLELIKSFGAYDSKKGSFTTFAKPIIMHGIGEHIINGMGLTRHEYNIYKMMGIYIDQCTSTNELTYEAYNEWVDRNVKQSKYYRTKYETWSYIYHKFFEDHEMINFDSLHEEEEESIYSIVCDIVDECDLTDQERAVIIERYKLDQKDRGRDVTSYKQIGKKMHIGYDTVKEIHERAIKKIQKSVRRDN